jgi:Protein of unknown function (DUF3455)
MKTLALLIGAIALASLTACSLSPMKTTAPTATNTPAAPAVAAAPATPAKGMSTVPEALQAAPSESAAFSWAAIGTQNYECKANDKGGWAWVFTAPEADLFNSTSEKVGKHGAGPYWSALDGSKIVGTVKARSDAANAADIPWLLLSTKAQGTAGKMSAVTSVQRLNTVGGVAPATGCSSAAEAGKKVKQDYRASYVFYVSKLAKTAY